MLSQGTRDRMWKGVKNLCAGRSWDAKNMAWHSFRRTCISFAVSRDVPILQLSRNAGIGSRHIKDICYHHESESKKTRDALIHNRVFYDSMRKKRSKLLVKIEDIMDSFGETMD